MKCIITLGFFFCTQKQRDTQISPSVYTVDHYTHAVSTLWNVFPLTLYVRFFSVFLSLFLYVSNYFSLLSTHFIHPSALQFLLSTPSHQPSFHFFLLLLILTLSLYLFFFYPLFDFSFLPLLEFTSFFFLHSLTLILNISLHVKNFPWLCEIVFQVGLVLLNWSVKNADGYFMEKLI